MPQFPALVQPAFYQLAAYALVLEGRQNGHRRQRQGRRGSGRAFDLYRREQDMPHDLPVFFRGKGKARDKAVRFADSVYQLGLVVPFEGLLVQLAYSADILRFLGPDRQCSAGIIHI